MGAYDDLLASGKAAVITAVSELAGTDVSDHNFAMAEAALGALDEVVPANVDAAWCLRVLVDRPEIFDVALDANDADTLKDAVRGAVIDHILDAIADDVEEHGRQIGIVPTTVTPGR